MLIVVSGSVACSSAVQSTGKVSLTSHQGQLYAPQYGVDVEMGEVEGLLELLLVGLRQLGLGHVCCCCWVNVASLYQDQECQSARSCG